MALSLLVKPVQTCEQRPCRGTAASKNRTTRGCIDATTIRIWTHHNSFGESMPWSNANIRVRNLPSPVDCRRARANETHFVGRHLDFATSREDSRPWRDDRSILRDPLQRSRFRRRRRLVPRSRPPQLRLVSVDVEYIVAAPKPNYPRTLEKPKPRPAHHSPAMKTRPN